MKRMHTIRRANKRPIGDRFFFLCRGGPKWLGAAAGLLCLARAAPSPAAKPLDEVAGIQRVCTDGPDHRIARAQRLRGTAAVTAAGVLPNPSLVVEHQRSLNTTEDREWVVGLAVSLGIGGRRGLLQDAAAARREQAFFDAHATLFDSALAFREAYVGAVVDRARVSVLSEQQALLDGLTATIQGLSKGGEVAAYDLLRQQTQARLHRWRLESAKARAQASQVLLEAWTGYDITLPPVTLADLAGGARSEGRPADRLVARHPRLASLEAESRASGLEARAARRRWVPDPEIFAGYRSAPAGSGTGHGVSLSLSVPLTFFDHGQGDAAQAEAQRELARATAASLRQKQQKLGESARVQVNALEAGLREAETATRDAAALQGKAQALYAAGEATITEVLEAFRVAEEARLAHIDVAEEIALARLSLMRAAGTLFDAALDRACGAREASAP